MIGDGHGEKEENQNDRIMVAHFFEIEIEKGVWIGWNIGNYQVNCFWTIQHDRQIMNVNHH